MKYIARIQGKVEVVLLCDLPQNLASSPKEFIQAELAGLIGDRHYGHTFASNGRYPYPRGTEIRNSRQISIISQEECGEVARVLGIPSLLPEWLGANILVSGIPALTMVPPSSRMHFANGAVIVLHGENDPCKLAGNVIQSMNPTTLDLSAAFVKAAFHKRGLVGWVEKPGRITSGETFILEVAEQFDYARILETK